MQVRTWKFITAGLVLVIIILCMMTFFLNGSNKNLLIQLNRADREKAQLNADYEKLYTAYYSYDKKVLKLLENNPNVFWAQDSSAYVVKNCFSFYKKPRMDKPHYLWLYYKEKVNIQAGITLTTSNYHLQDRIDSLKSHQFFCFDRELGNNFESIFIAPLSATESNEPDTSKTVATIHIN